MAAGEEVEDVRDGGEDDLEASTAPPEEPGVLQISASPTVPQTARDSIPKPRPPASLARADRLGQARRLALDHGPRALRA